MSISIHIEGANADEVIAQLLGLSRAHLQPQSFGTVLAQHVAEAAAAAAAETTLPAHAIVAAPPPGEEAAVADAVVAATPKKSRAKAAAPATPAPVEPAAVQAQDKADEAAEVAANRDPETPLTREDVKKAMTGYVQTYGMAHTQTDGPIIFKEALGEPPAGEKYWKLSLVDESNQEALAKAVATWERATAENPLKREKVA
jgi:hypothetical protein